MTSSQTKRREPTAPMRDQPPGRAALLIIDMVNPLDFDEREVVLPRAVSCARAIARLRGAADACDCPTIFVNDNFGEWHSEKARLIARTDPALANHLEPRDRDYFIIKPQFSGFYATNLPVLLPKLGVNRLILTGVATEICVLFTAADAHMRDYDLWVPRDGTAAVHQERGEAALDIMRETMGAKTTACADFDLTGWFK